MDVHALLVKQIEDLNAQLETGNLDIQTEIVLRDQLARLIELSEKQRSTLISMLIQCLLDLLLRLTNFIR